MNIRKYMRLYFNIVKVSLEGQLSYPKDFIIQIIVWTVYSFMSFIGLYLLMMNYVAVDSVRFVETMYMYGVITISYNAARMIARSFDDFNRLTMSGDLDVFYIRPLPIVFQVMSSNLFLRRISGIFQGVLVLVYYSLSVEISIYKLIIITCLIILNTMIMYIGLLVCYGALCFVSENGNLFLNLLVDTSSSIGYYPLNLVTGVVKYLLVIIIPIYNVVYIPSTLLMNGDGSVFLYSIISSIVSVTMLIASICIFNIMSKKYQSVNS